MFDGAVGSLVLLEVARQPGGVRVLLSRAKNGQWCAMIQDDSPSRGCYGPTRMAALAGAGRTLDLEEVAREILSAARDQKAAPRSPVVAEPIRNGNATAPEGSSGAILETQG